MTSRQNETGCKETECANAQVRSRYTYIEPAQVNRRDPNEGEVKKEKSDERTEDSSRQNVSKLRRQVSAEMEGSNEKEGGKKKGGIKKDGKKMEDPHAPEDGVPYDRGWAWMVCFGAFISFVIGSGYNTANFVFFVKFLEVFEAPVSKTALLYGVKQAVNSVIGMFVMNAFVERVGVRMTVILGGLFFGLSAILGSFATDLTFLIMTQALFHGLGLAMCGMSPTLLIGFYFRRRRSLANSISKCGVGVGAMFFPPMVTYFLQEYGLRGSLLLLGGICLNTVAAAALMRPLSYYTKRHRLRSEAESCSKSDVCEEATEKETFEVTDETDTRKVTEDDHKLLSNSLGRKSHLVKGVHNNGVKVNGAPMSHRGYQIHVTSLTPCKDDVALLTRSTPDILYHTKPMVTSPRRRTATISEADNVRIECSESPVSTSFLDILENSSIARYLSRPHLYNDTPILLLTEDSSTSEPEQQGKKSTCKNQPWRFLKDVAKVLDFRLFRSPMFRVMTVFFVTSPVINAMPAFFPAMCKDRGVSDSQAALLLSIIGGLDLCSRLIFGFLADLKILKVSTLMALTFIVLGAVMQLTRLLTAFPHMIGLAVIYGLLGGVSACLVPILIMEDIGLEHTAKALGFCKLFSAASMAAALPSLGYLRDFTGDYDVTNHVAGVFGLASAALLLILRFFPHRHLRHQEQITVVLEECSALNNTPQK